MDDEELAQIRKARLDQLKSLSGKDGKGISGINGSDEEQQNENEIRKSLLAQILEPEAADRLGRVRLVKESLVQEVENRLIALARSGQLRGKVTESQLKQLLSAMSETKEEEKIVISRKKGAWHNEIDDLDEFL